MATGNALITSEHQNRDWVDRIDSAPRQAEARHRVATTRRCGNRGGHDEVRSGRALLAIRRRRLVVVRGVSMQLRLRGIVGA
jgi:hypothetical protein